MRAIWVAGIVSHDDYQHLDACIASLQAQTHPPVAVIIADTGVDRARFDALTGRHPHADWRLRDNRGYGAGANGVLAEVADSFPTASHVLILNADIDLDTDFAESLLHEMEARPTVALASGKLLRADRVLIDSAGICLPRHRRPRDRGSEERDHGQYDELELIFGVSGAAMMIRRAALADLAVDGEVFDEDFFAYQDDTDLCWRAHLVGWEVLYAPSARAVHARRWQRAKRSQIAPRVRQHSFANHYLQIVKNERWGDLLRNLPVLMAWELLRLGYALIRDRGILGGYRMALEGLPMALRKRRVIQRRAVLRAHPPGTR